MINEIMNTEKIENIISPPYDAELIADWFIARNRILRVEQDGEMLTNLKLQKLLYYAQGVFLAIYDQPLFSNELEAWQHGPVVRDIYNKFSKFGSNGINDNVDMPQSLSTESVAVLEDIFEVFGQYSAWKLRNMTHDEKPWQETKQNEVISLNIIKDYFLEEYVS